MSDVESILSRQYCRLELAHVREQLPPLLELKDDIESLGRLEKLIRTVDERLRNASET